MAGQDTCGRLHAIAHETFNLSPDVRITLALHMARSKGAVEPGAALALHRTLPIVELVVTQNLGLGFVGRAD